MKNLAPIIVRNGDVFVCRRLPTNKKEVNSLRSLRLCGETIVCDNLRVSAVKSSSPNLASLASLREASFLKIREVVSLDALRYALCALRTAQLRTLIGR